jgi:hypothetical protein
MNMAKITSIDELKIAVEDAAEAKIFENVWMASEEAKQEAFAKGLSIVVLEGNQIVEIASDGKTKKVLKTLDLQPVGLDGKTLKIVKDVS